MGYKNVFVLVIYLLMFLPYISKIFQLVHLTLVHDHKADHMSLFTAFQQRQRNAGVDQIPRGPS